ECGLRCLTASPEFLTILAMHTPWIFSLARALIALLLVPCYCQAADRRYLYLASPDGAQPGGSGNGILVFDIDDGHRFVRRIEVPIFREGLRGLTGNAKTHCVYFSTTNRRLGCLDLETDQVLWEQVYKLGCDRSAITLDGKKI